MLGTIGVKRWAAGLGALVLAAGPAAAQDMGGWAMDLGSSGVSTAQWSSVMNGAVKAAGGNAPAGQRAAARPGVRPAAAVAPARGVTTYRASPAVSARVKQQFASFAAKQGGGTQVAADLKRIDPVKVWSDVVRAEGLRPGDTVDAFTAYWLLNWMIANQSMGGDAGAAAAVKAQVRPSMQSNPAFARLSEAQRQELAEGLMLNFLYQHKVYDDAVRRNDGAMKAKLANAAAARFRNEFQIDLKRLDLTDRGFVSRG